LGGSDVADAGFRSQPATRRSSSRWLSPPALSLFEVCRLAAERAASKRRACCDLLSWHAAEVALFRSWREQQWRAGPARRQCRCFGLGVAQLGSEPWRGTVDASLLLIDEIDCPRVRRSLT
jgi:hypothetical protein